MSSRRRLAQAAVALTVATPLVVGVLAASAGAAPVTADSQNVGDNYFLSNGIAEVGSRANGSFGSNVNAPAGYHPNWNNRLGFRSDRGKDGWGVGYDDGDFFVPGSPYEGWAIQVGDNAAPRWNSNGSNSVAGTWAAASTPTSAVGTWQSSAPVDGISVRQDVSVPAGAQYLNVDVTLTNTTSQALTDVYYGRGVDADNCRTAQTAVCDGDGDGVADSTGVYETFNQVRSQLTTGDSVAAVSSDQTDGSYIDLRSSAPGTTVAAGIQNAFCTTPDLDSIAVGSTGTDPTDGTADCGLSTTKGQRAFADDTIFLSTKTSTLAAGASRTFRVQYVLSQAAANDPGTSPQPPATSPTPPSTPTAPAATKAGTVYTKSATRNTKVSGTGAPGATITVREGKRTLGTTTVDAKGRWTFTVKSLKPGTHRLSATQTVNGRTSAPSSAGQIRVERLKVRIVKATDPTKANRPLIRGRGNPGATVTVITNRGKVIGRTKVRTDGVWRLRSATKLDRGSYKIRATQSIAGTTIRSTTVRFTAVNR